MDDKLAPLLVGAVLTLIVTVLVQTVIVPWVQARTRRIERWETSVVELASLLEEELPRSVSEFRSAAESELLYRALRNDPDYDQDRIREALQRESTRRREMAEVVGQHRRRMKVLVSRVIRLRRSAPLWLRFRRAELVLDFELSNATHLMVLDQLTSSSDERWSEVWSRYAAAEKRFTELVQALASSMRLPPRLLRKRLIARLGTWRKAHLSRGRPAQAAISTGDKPDSSASPSP